MSGMTCDATSLQHEICIKLELFIYNQNNTLFIGVLAYSYNDWQKQHKADKTLAQ